MPLKFRKIQFQNSLNLVVDGPFGVRLSETAGTNESGISLLPNATYFRTFVAPALNSGTYYIQFFAQSSPEVQAIAVEEGVETIAAWGK